MDILDDELLNFWRSLNNNQVRYIMVGGFATRFTVLIEIPMILIYG